MISRKVQNFCISGRAIVQDFLRSGGLFSDTPLSTRKATTAAVSSSSWLERSRLPELLAQAAVAFADDGCAVLDDVLDERDIRRLRDQVHQLFHTTSATTPNSTFVVDNTSRNTTLFPKAHIHEYDFRSAGPSGFDLLDSTHNDATFSHMLDAILNLTGNGGMSRPLAGQNVKVQLNAGNGGCFPIHYDTDGTYDSRKLSCILYLNEAKVDGGELVMYPYGKPRILVEPRLNRLAIFRSDTVAHRVLPCFSERYCLTIWCSEPARDTHIDEFEKEKLHILVNALHAVSGDEERQAVRQAIEEQPIVRKLLTKYALEDEWRQSLLESHDPSPARDVLLQSFDTELESIRSFVRLLDGPREST